MTSTLTITITETHEHKDEVSLQNILRYSIFSREKDLLLQFEHLSGYETGTFILIYNLKQ